MTKQTSKTHRCAGSDCTREVAGRTDLLCERCKSYDRETGTYRADRGSRAYLDEQGRRGAANLNR